MQRSTSLEHMNGTTVDLAVFDIKRSEVKEQMRGQKGSPKPTEASEKREEMSPTQHECRQVPCLRATYCRHNNDAGSIFPPPFMASTPIIFYDKLEWDSICL